MLAGLSGYNVPSQPIEAPQPGAGQGGGAPLQPVNLIKQWPSGSNPYTGQMGPSAEQRALNSNAYWEAVRRKGGQMPTVSVNAFGEVVSDKDPSAVSTTSNGTVPVDKNGRVVATGSPDAVATKSVPIPIPSPQVAPGRFTLPDWFLKLVGGGGGYTDLYGPKSPQMSPMLGTELADWQNYVLPDVLRGGYPIDLAGPPTPPLPAPVVPPKQTWYDYGGGGWGGYGGYSSNPNWTDTLTRWTVRR